MPELTLEKAQTIVSAALKYSRDAKFKPMGVVVLDARSAVVACAIEDNSALRRFDFIPVPGGVLIKNATGAIIGAVGVSGDTSDNDEAAGVAGIKAAGLVADAG
jgi:uncharacterized protein GlcG (DUF336 family)